MSLLLVAFSVVLLAAATQAMIGFGFALVAVPLLSLTLDPRTAVVGVGIAGLVLTVAVAVQERRHARWPVVGLLLGALVAGMPVGLLVLRTAPDRLLTAMIGAAVVACAGLIWRGLRIPTTRPAVLGLGALAGVLATSTGTNGPPLVAAFQAMGYEPRAFRATLAAIFTGSGLLAIAGFALAGQVSAAALQVGAIGVPASLLGWWGGNLAFRKLDPRRFRQVVLGALMAGGAVLVVRAVTG